MRQSRWIVIFTCIALAYASGFIPFSIDERFLLRNIQAEQGRTAKNRFVSQIQEVGIGVKKAAAASVQNDGEEWGIAEQIGEHTWTIKVGQDKQIGTAQDIFSALNNYRQRHGKGTLSWDQKLSAYAQSRADFFAARGDLDSHAGFTDFVNNQEGFNKLGFMGLGENSSYGYSLEGVHLIEWVYAGDKPHDDNQLNSEWTHVGIGVSGTAANLIFGGKKL